MREVSDTEILRENNFILTEQIGLFGLLLSIKFNGTEHYVVFGICARRDIWINTILGDSGMGEKFTGRGDCSQATCLRATIGTIF